tara:strand:+ start:362 stop:901 length:540 start_codon:yes stop_codon:yes gene_type:complete
LYKKKIKLRFNKKGCIYYRTIAKIIKKILNNKIIFTGNLKPQDAVCAVIKYKNKILLQKRDNKKDIFFPGHYGLFGGAIEKKETKFQALKRELSEEIGLNLNLKKVKYLTNLKLDFKKIGHKVFSRSVYVIEISTKESKNLSLGEGKKMIFIKPLEAYFKLRLIPYDAFALWLFLFKKK